MVVTTLKTRRRETAKVRIEPVDNWHVDWKKIRAHVKKHGDASKLQIDADGWLSARQVLLVAFVGKQVAGHLCFSVAPGKTCIEARLDDYGIAPKFRDRQIESALREASLQRVESLRCEKLRGFRIGTTWKE